MAIRIPEKQVMPTEQVGATVISPGQYDAEYQSQRDVLRAGQRLGQEIGRVGDMILDGDIRKEQSQMEGVINEQKAEQQTYMESTSDYESYGPEWEKRVKKIKDAQANLKHAGSRRWAENRITQYSPVWDLNVKKHTRRAQVEDISSETTSFIQSIPATDYTEEADVANGGYAEAQTIKGVAPENIKSMTEREYKEQLIKEKAQEMVDTNIWSPQHADAIIAGSAVLLDKVDAARVDQAIGNIEVAAAESMRSGQSYKENNRITTEDKQTAMSIAEASLTLMQEEGMISPAEMVNHRKDINNWIDNDAQEYNANQDKQDDQNHLEITKDLIGKFSTGKATFSDIESSGLTKTEQNKMNERLSNYYSEEPPKKNTNSGLISSVGTVLDAAMLTMSPQEAYDLLMEERYDDFSITDDQIQWAVDKIDNPYPKEIVPDIRATFNDNLHGHNRTFSGETNEALMNWIDAKLAKGETPTRKEMYGYSSQARIDAMNIPRRMDVGQVITRGDREYEVTGFDNDGTPRLKVVEW